MQSEPIPPFINVDELTRLREVLETTTTHLEGFKSLFDEHRVVRDPDLFVGDSSDRAVLDTAATIPASVLEAWSIVPTAIDSVTAFARAEITRRANGTPAPTIAESQLRPLLEASEARVKELEEESENRLAEIHALGKALQVEESTRLKLTAHIEELQARLGIPSIVRNTRAKCPGCGSEFMTAADPAEAKVLDTLAAARIHEAQERAFFEDTASEDRICRAELARRRGYIRDIDPTE